MRTFIRIQFHQKGTVWLWVAMIALMNIGCGKNLKAQADSENIQEETKGIRLIIEELQARVQVPRNEASKLMQGLRLEGLGSAKAVNLALSHSAKRLSQAKKEQEALAKEIETAGEDLAAYASKYGNK